MLMHLKPALILFVILSAITGGVYPALVTAIGQLVFPQQANGSLIRDDKGKIVGSELIGQAFGKPEYFWGRPSATVPFPYNASASSGSNLGPTNPALANAIKARIEALQAADPDNKAAVPVDLVTASGSGLDPHISPAAAEFQLNRVARARGLAPAELRELVARYTESPSFGVLGEPRVNVLRLNLALDQMRGPAHRQRSE